MGKARWRYRSVYEPNSRRYAFQRRTEGEIVTPNGPAHQLGAAVTVSTICAYHKHKNSQNMAIPVINAGHAGLLGTRLDILEPPPHPSHQQFFHRLGFAGMAIYDLYRLYQWSPEEQSEQLLESWGQNKAFTYY